MLKTRIAAVVVLTILSLTVGMAIFDAYEKKAVPSWVVTLCISVVSAVVYSQFKRQNGNHKEQ